MADVIRHDGLQTPSVDGRSGEFVWVSCDETDQDPGRLWSTLANGLSRGEVAELPVSGSDPLDILSELLSDAPPLVVIDDAQRAGDAIATLQPLVERVPAGTRLVVTTTSRPPLHLERLSAGGHLTEILQPDLDFTADEVATLLASEELELEDAVVEALHSNTEGWIAPITLVLDASERQTSSERCAQLALLATSDEAAPMPKVVRRFFSDAIRDLGGEGALDLLLDLVSLGRFNVADCRAVLGAPQADEFRRFESAGLFISQADDGESYRFNTLFDRFLKSEVIGRQGTPGTDLHRTAAKWFASRGATARAVQHHFAAGDTSGAVDTFILGMLEGNGQVSRRNVAAWLDETDEDQVRATRSPWAFAVYALVLAHAGETVRALQWLRAAESIGPTDSDLDIRLLARMGIEMIEGRPAQVVACHEELQTLRQRSGRPEDLVEVLAGVGARCWVDDLEGARSTMESYAASSPPGVHRAVLAAPESFLLAVEGRLEQAASAATKAICRADDEGVGDHWAMTGAWRARALVAYEQGRFGDARAALTSWMDRGMAGISSLNLLVQTQLAHVEVSDGRMTVAKRIGVTASQTAIDPRSPLWDQLTALETRLAMMTGEFGRARWLVEHMQSPSLASLMGARVAIAAGDVVRADGLLRPLAMPAQWRHQLDLLIARARVAKRLGDDEGGQHWLGYALDMAVPELAVAAFFEDGPDLWESIAKQLRSRAADEYFVTAAGLVGQARPLGRPIEAPIESGAEWNLIASLRPREFHVLRLVGEGFANRDIAAALQISPNTLKTHIRRLYSRLGINSRSEAVEIARGLLSDARPSID